MFFKINFKYKFAKIIYFSFIYFFLLKFFKYYNCIEYNDIILIFICYFFINLFFYFNTIYKTSTFNNFQKNFWIRSFFIFWLLEFFLFFIFLYLLLICPEKQYYAYEIINNHVFFKGNFKNSNLTLLFLLFLIFLINILILVKVNNKMLLSFIMIYLTLFLFNIFKSELKLFFSILGILTDVNFDFEQNNEFNFIKTKNNKIIYQHSKHFNSLKDCIEFRPKLFMLSTIIFLKFFHILFILIFFLLNTLKFIHEDNISFLQSAINLHNFIVLIIFYILNWTMPFKYFFHFLIEFNYKNVFLFYNLNSF